jgi:hypothetical protein
MVVPDARIHPQFTASLAWPKGMVPQIQREKCVMKFQKDPSRARMISLLSGASQVAVDEVTCNGIGVADRLHVETIRDELASIVGSGNHSGVSEVAPELDEIAVRIGSALRELNSRGLYLCAETQFDGPTSLVATDDNGRRTHTVVIKAVIAQRAAG